MQNSHSLLGLVWSSFHCFLLFYALFIVVHCFLMGLCIDGSCWSGGPLGLVGLLVWWALGLVGPWVWWSCGSGGPVGLVGPWVWWARGSGGPVGLVGPWVNFKGSDMPRCPWSSFSQRSWKILRENCWWLARKGNLLPTNQLNL